MDDYKCNSCKHALEWDLLEPLGAKKIPSVLCGAWKPDAKWCKATKRCISHATKDNQ